jgi:hypothetical protein
VKVRFKHAPKKGGPGNVDVAITRPAAAPRMALPIGNIWKNLAASKPFLA